MARHAIDADAAADEQLLVVANPRDHAIGPRCRNRCRGGHEEVRRPVHRVLRVRRRLPEVQ